ncbi:MAG TPA: hypothetical protein VFS23_20205 [Vicinamibacterales bacterium]|nr:hypothetical protein [Vicinamibacterales bacterium]
MAFLEWLETLSYAAWVRESPSLLAFPSLLFIHTLGMALVAGGSAVISMALLGMWPRTSIKPLERLYPVMWFGFWINLFSGVSIFIKDATIYGRNPDVYVKLVFVAAGVALLTIIRKRVFGGSFPDSGPVPGNAKILAWASLGCWFCAIVAGRLIAYVGPVPGL